MFLEDNRLTRGETFFKFLNRIIKEIKLLGFEPIVGIVDDAYYDDEYIIILNNFYYLSFSIVNFNEPFHESKTLNFSIHKMTRYNLLDIIKYNHPEVPTKKHILKYLQDFNIVPEIFHTFFNDITNREKINIIINKIKELNLKNSLTFSAIMEEPKKFIDY